MLDAPRPALAAIRTDLGAIFVSLELSRRTWLITSLSPGAGEKMSQHAVAAADVSGLLRRFAELKRKAAARTGRATTRLPAALPWNAARLQDLDASSPRIEASIRR